MIELNLLPDVKKEFIKTQRTRNTVVSLSILITIIAGGLTVLLVSYVFAAQPLIISVQTSEIKKNAEALSSIPEIDKYLTVQNQLSSIKGLHDDRELYSRLFGYLEKLNPTAPNNIALSSATVNRDLKFIVIEGTARDFQAVNVFMNTLENASLVYKDSQAQEQTMALFETIILDQAGLADTNGTVLANFKLTLTYDELAFSVRANDSSVSVPSLTTSDADRNAPKQLFNDKPEGVQ